MKCMLSLKCQQYTGQYGYRPKSEIPKILIAYTLLGNLRPMGCYRLHIDWLNVANSEKTLIYEYYKVV